MEWTAEAIDHLRTLWAEGHSTAEIGRRMGISKNAVVGKAHRLNLPARPSPIRRDAEGASAAPRPAPVRRSPAPPRPAPMPMRRLEPGMPLAAQAPMGPPAVAPAPVVVAPVASIAPRPVQPMPAAVVRPFPRAAVRSCCWPMGEPGTPEFRFCGGDAMAGKPYCPDHAAVAYVKVRDRREDAA